MHRWKSRGGKSQRREDQRRERVRRKKIAGAREGRKVAIHSVFPMICGSGGSKSRLAKAAGAEPCGQMRDEKLHAGVARNTFPSQNAQAHHFGPLWKLTWSKKCTSVWREAHFQVKTRKAHHFGPVLKLTWSKVHAVVARSTFGSQTVQNTPCWDHFGSWHVERVHAVVAQSTFPSQKRAKHTMLGALLEVWDVEKVYAVVVRSTFPSQNVQSTPCSDHLWRFRCDFAWHAQGILHLAKSEPKGEGFVAFPKNDSRRGTFSDRVGRQPHRRSNTCSKHTAWSQWLCFGSFTMSDGMPWACQTYSSNCVVVFVPCPVCLLWRHRMCYLKMSVPDVCLPFSYLFSDGTKSRTVLVASANASEKCWVLCTKGMALEGCLTFVSFGSYTTTEIRVCSRCLFFCANVNCLLSNCLDGKMKNHMDGWVKRLGT